jgi:hypothetical protein
MLKDPILKPAVGITKLDPFPLRSHQCSLCIGLVGIAGQEFEGCLVSVVQLCISFQELIVPTNCAVQTRSIVTANGFLRMCGLREKGDGNAKDRIAWVHHLMSFSHPWTEPAFALFADVDSRFSWLETCLHIAELSNSDLVIRIDLQALFINGLSFVQTSEFHEDIALPAQRLS